MFAKEAGWGVGAKGEGARPGRRWGRKRGDGDGGGAEDKREMCVCRQKIMILANSKEERLEMHRRYNPFLLWFSVHIDVEARNDDDYDDGDDDKWVRIKEDEEEDDEVRTSMK